MAWDWEKHREEICDLYYVQGKSMQEVGHVMQERHSFKPCERSYWKKIKQWDVQKHAPARRALHTSYQSIDSGYQSRSFRGAGSIISQSSQSTDDVLPHSEALATPNQQEQQCGFPRSAEHSSALKSRFESRPDSPYSLTSYQADDFPIDAAFRRTISPRPLESHSFSQNPFLSAAQSVNQSNDRAAHPPSSFLVPCGSRNRLSSCILGFCGPHTLPSRCFAAHLNLEQIDPHTNLISCQYCDAAVPYHLMSMACMKEPVHYEEFLHKYQHLLGNSDGHGNTCVHFAAGSGASLAQLEALSRAEAPMTRTNNDGQTYLHVLNAKLYDRHTLPPIIQWALHTKGAMAKRDSRNRTVWHAIFQRGISLEVFRGILPYLNRSKDDLMILDEDCHTPLDCLRSYWTSTKEMEGIDCLNALQSSGHLPLYFAINQTAPLDDASYTRTPTRLPTNPEISADVSRLPIRTTTKRYDVNDSMRYCVDETLSNFRNGGALECINILPPDLPPNHATWSARTTPLPMGIRQKARRVLGRF